MEYLLNNWSVVGRLLLVHLRVVTTAVAIAVIIAMPLGLLVRAVRPLAVPILGMLGVIYTIPSLATIVLLVPFLGLSAKSVIAAAVLYSQAILARNLLAGLEAIDPTIVEAAKGMGMTPWQRWWWVQFPLALPTILAGVRLAAIVTVAITAIGAKFGAGGLGVLLFEGVQQNRTDKIAIGTLALTLLAFGLNRSLRWLEARSRPESRIEKLVAKGS